MSFSCKKLGKLRDGQHSRTTVNMCWILLMYLDLGTVCTQPFQCMSFLTDPAHPGDVCCNYPAGLILKLDVFLVLTR